MQGLQVDAKAGPAHSRSAVVSGQSEGRRAAQEGCECFCAAALSSNRVWWRLSQAPNTRQISDLDEPWRARLGSNQQPLPSEGSTLSIELRAQRFCILAGRSRRFRRDLRSNYNPT